MPRQIATAQAEGQGEEDAEQGSAYEIKEKMECLIILAWFFSIKKYINIL